VFGEAGQLSPGLTVVMAVRTEGRKVAKRMRWRTRNLSCEAKIVAIRRDSISTARLVSPSFSEVHFSDIDHLSRIDHSIIFVIVAWTFHLRRTAMERCQGSPY